MKLLKGLMGNQSLSSTLGKQLLGGLLGGGQQQQQSSQSSGLASILSGVLGSGQSGGSQGGGTDLMSGLLGSLMGGGSSGGGGINPMGAISGGQAQSGSALSKAAGMVSGAMAQNQTEAPSANDQAVLMIRAMVNAAKSDGRIDEAEQQNIIGKLGNDVSEAEIDFLRKEFAAPLDAAGFARSVPRGLEHQIYAISLTSIELDTQNEANYLGQLAQNLNISPEICNQIHDQLGAPKIFG